MNAHVNIDASKAVQANAAEYRDRIGELIITTYDVAMMAEIVSGLVEDINRRRIKVGDGSGFIVSNATADLLDWAAHHAKVMAEKAAEAVGDAERHESDHQPERVA